MQNSTRSWLAKVKIKYNTICSKRDENLFCWKMSIVCFVPCVGHLESAWESSRSFSIFIKCNTSVSVSCLHTRSVSTLKYRWCKCQLNTRMNSVITCRYSADDLHVSRILCIVASAIEMGLKKRQADHSYQTFTHQKYGRTCLW